MGDLSAGQDAALSAIARLLDVPEEFLRIPLPITPEERAAAEAALLRDAEAAYVEAARLYGPGIIAGAGLDPERYQLVYVYEEEIPHDRNDARPADRRNGGIDS